MSSHQWVTMQCMCRARVPLSSLGLWCTWRETCAKPHPSKRTPASRHTCRSAWICLLCIWAPPLQSYWVNTHTHSPPASSCCCMGIQLKRESLHWLLFSPVFFFAVFAWVFFVLRNLLCSDNSLTSFTFTLYESVFSLSLPAVFSRCRKT